ncbi:uberolysin/carnocyclin family circular bacteriocin [Nocardioides sp.]|uniref:uberolysin/carnocyclin family circular bacteriocin n=1 Tax=Nocardioides sp. TaxID=35761 RepID=UPI003D11D628
MEMKKSGTLGLTLILATLGIATAGVGLAWVAGSLGISASAASQIVSAIMAGGWALTVVMAIFGGGIISAIAATVRWYVVKKGRAVAIV